MVITRPVSVFPRQKNPTGTMESWDTEKENCYYDKDVYNPDAVCFARTMLKDNLEILRNGSAPPQVCTVGCVAFPLCFLVPFLPQNVAFLHFLISPNHLDHHSPCPPLPCSPSLSLSPPSFPPSFYFLQERVIGNDSRQSIFIQFAHSYISQNKALNGYIVLSSKIEEGLPVTTEQDLILGLLCFVCLVPAIYALGEMRDEAMKRHECVYVCVCVCLCVFVCGVYVCAVLLGRGDRLKKREKNQAFFAPFVYIDYHPAWITHTNVLHSPLPVLLHCCAKDGKEKSKDAFNAVKDLIAGTRKDKQNTRETKRERERETKRE